MQNSEELAKLKDILHASVAENMKNMVIATRLEVSVLVLCFSCLTHSNILCIPPSLVKCLQCHATFLKSEALELQNASVVMSYQSAKEYACPFCKSQYHFEREPAVNQGLGSSSLTHSNSPASKSMGQGQADTKHHRELSEVNPLMPLLIHSVNSSTYVHTCTCVCI